MHITKYPSQSNNFFYKEYRNMLTRLLRQTERTYYDRLLIDNRNNLKKTWSFIKNALQVVNVSLMVILSLTTLPLLNILINIL